MRAISHLRTASFNARKLIERKMKTTQQSYNAALLYLTLAIKELRKIEESNAGYNVRIAVKHFADSIAKDVLLSKASYLQQVIVQADSHDILATKYLPSKDSKELKA